MSVARGEGWFFDICKKVKGLLTGVQQVERPYILWGRIGSTQGGGGSL